MEAYDLKDSGVDCLGKIPKHWVKGKVKNRFFLKPSNVDKKSYDNEIPVELCNYVDVYYNDFITNDLKFMSATATAYEIKKFSLELDDVILTKDSEDPMDIGVPALVKEIKPNLVCGYHLTMLRKRPCHVSGSFLFWALSDKAIASQFYREATGVTRWAISSRNIKNVAIAYPDLEEQKAIADYLDQACQNIDKIINLKQQQLEKLTAYRKSVIHEAVTKGLDKTVKMKDSGVEWLGDIPEHWDISQLKYVIEFHDNKRIPISSEERGGMQEKVYDYYGASGVIDKVEGYIFDEPMILLGEDGANLITRSKTLAFIARGQYWVNNHAHILKPKHGSIEYWGYVLENMEYSLFVTGAAQPKLSSMNLGKVQLIYSKDIEEQKTIVNYLYKVCQNIDQTKENLSQQIKTLTQYRQSLIHECVTGKKRIYQGDVN